MQATITTSTDRPVRTRLAGPSLAHYSSRMLMGLMELSRVAEMDARERTQGTPTVPLSSQLLGGLLSALELRDLHTYEHSLRVARLATGLAHHLGWDGDALESLRIAALLHDVGKIGVPDHLLYKPGPLSADELELMGLYVATGLDVLQACRAHASVLSTIAQSKRSLAHTGEAAFGPQELNLGARILAIADAYDSMSNSQIYRSPKTHAEAIGSLTDGAGAQFDGNLVDAFTRWMSDRSAQDRSQMMELPQVPSSDVIDPFALCQIFNYVYTLENLYDGFYLLDSDLKFVVWNQGAQHLFARRAESMIGRPWASRSVGYVTQQSESIPDRQCPLHAAMETGHPGMSRQYLVREDGRKLQVELQTLPLIDARGNLQGAAEVFRRLDRDDVVANREVAELRLAASRDALTRVANRGELERQLNLLESRHKDDPSKTPYSVIFVDVDHFKSVNDTYGHATGDQVLIDMARILQREMFMGEVVGRYGGEEFVVLCPETPLEDGIRRAERLRKVISTTPMGGSIELKKTASFGVAQREEGDTPDAVLKRADKALYEAKHHGRDQTRSLSLLQRPTPKDEPAEKPKPKASTQVTQPMRVVMNTLGPKIAGYVRDANARIVVASPEYLELRVGRSLMLGCWGWNGDEQPVTVQILLPKHDERTMNARSTSTLGELTTTVRPRGWGYSTAAFARRADEVFRELRLYLAAVATE